MLTRALHRAVLWGMCSLNSTVQYSTVLYWWSVISGRWPLLRWNCCVERWMWVTAPCRHTDRHITDACRLLAGQLWLWLTDGAGMRCENAQLPHDSLTLLHSTGRRAQQADYFSHACRAVPLCPSGLAEWCKAILLVSVSCRWLMTGDSRGTFQRWHALAKRL